MVDYSEKFYARHAERYAEVSRQLLQSIYIESSHPGLTGDLDLLEHLKTVAPGRRCLDAGCGAGARDVFGLWSAGYDVFGMDTVRENIDTAARLHPEIADRLVMADLRARIPFPDSYFHFVMCNAVIQHIEPEIVKKITLPELCRVLQRDGILQLMIKNGEGVISVFDRDYGEERAFQLYDELELLRLLEKIGMDLIENESV